MQLIFNSKAHHNHSQSSKKRLQILNSAATLLAFFSTLALVTSFLPSVTHYGMINCRKGNRMVSDIDDMGTRTNIEGVASEWNPIQRFEMNSKKKIFLCASRSPSLMSSHLFMSNKSENEDGGVDFDSLMDMDVVLFTRKNKSNSKNDDENAPNLELGAIQEDGTLAPISAWTLESAFSTSSTSDSIEFLVDEEDRFPGLTADDVIIHTVLDETLVSYGSRQVGGGKGPGNPHGEESELLYYVERSVVEEEDEKGGNRVNVVMKPELEILW